MTPSAVLPPLAGQGTDPGHVYLDLAHTCVHCMAWYVSLRTASQSRFSSWYLGNMDTDSITQCVMFTKILYTKLEVNRYSFTISAMRMEGC